jgi:hypothetical protein
MAFRFRRSVKIAPGIRLNFSGSGVSTTFGVRGLSVNVGRRGAFLNTGIPGTGLHSRSRIGGGGGSAALGNGGNAAAGCLGCGGIGFLLLLVIAIVGSIADSAGRSGGSYTPALATIDSSSYAQQRTTLYARGRVKVRSGAGKTFAVVRTLSRGDAIVVADADARGWTAAYATSGRRIGYVYLPTTRLRPSPPASGDGDERPSRHRQRSQPSGASAICRDGTYSYSAHRRGTCSHHGGVAQWL